CMIQTCDPTEPVFLSRPLRSVFCHSGQVLADGKGFGDFFHLDDGLCPVSLASVQRENPFRHVYPVMTKTKCMKNPLYWLRPMSALIGFTLVAPLAHAEVALNLAVPKKLPRNTGLQAYSPALRLEYSGVPKGHHRLKLWLLESST